KRSAAITRQANTSARQPESSVKDIGHRLTFGQLERPTQSIVDLGFRVETQCPEDVRGQIARRVGWTGRIRSNSIAVAVHVAPIYSSACHCDPLRARPVIAAAGAYVVRQQIRLPNLRFAAELNRPDDRRFVKQPALVYVFF